MEKLREKQERKKDKKNKQLISQQLNLSLKLFLFKQATMYALKDRPVSDRLMELNGKNAVSRSD